MTAGNIFRSSILASLCLLASLAFATVPALAVTKYVKVSSFGSGGALPGAPFGLGVEQASGEVLVADGASVQRFAPVSRVAPSSGYTLGLPLSGSFASAFGVGIDDSGGLSQSDVYVADEAAGLVDKFDAAGAPAEVDPPINTTDHFGAGAEPLALSNPTAAAVDPADGDVYVADYSGHEGAGSAVDIYTSAGQFVSQFAVGSGPIGLAFNSTGSDLYVAAGNTGKVEEYDSLGAPAEQTAGPNAGTNILDGSGLATAVAVDTSTNDVYVDDGTSVAVYEASGAPVGAFGFQTGVSFSLGIALDSSTHAVFLGDVIDGVVDAYAEVTLPTVNTGHATAVTETSATLEGTVDPEGQPLTSCEFEYGTSTSYEQKAECEPNTTSIPADSSDHTVRASVKGLQPDVTYHYRLVATNAEGAKYNEAEQGEDESLTTVSPPIVVSESFSEVGPTQATLHAVADAAGSPSTYEFEYGTSASYGAPGSPTASVVLGEGQGEVPVSATITGLRPDTVYHFRVVASNAHGATPGADAVFTTFPYTPSNLPDGRVYEMVTPVENQNASVYVPDGPESEKALNSIPTELPFRASSEGDAVVYAGDPSSGGNGSVGGGGGNEYLAERSPTGGWTQQNIQPGGYYSPIYAAFSDDLSVGVLDSRESLVAGAPGAPLGAKAGYDVPYTYTFGGGGYHPLFTRQPPNRAPEEFGTAIHLGGETRIVPPLYAGASADFGHLLFEANDALLEGEGPLAKALGEAVAQEAKEGGDSNDLYDSVGGKLSLVNVLPDGAPAPNASFGALGTAASPPDSDFSHVISANGSRIFWTDLNTGDIYVRQNDSTTIPISAGAGQFWTATPDGRYVFYTEGGLLWRFDVDEFDESTKSEQEALEEAREDLTPEGPAHENAGVQGVVGINEEGEDGAYLYFVAEGALAPRNAEGKAPVKGEPNLYVRHGGHTTFVAGLARNDDEFFIPVSGAAEFGDWQPGLAYRTAEVTPDGHNVVFMSRQSLTGYDNKGLREVYVYESEAGESGQELFCASCNPSGEPPSGVPGGVAAYLPFGWGNTQLPRWISQNGSRVFFDSVEPLVPSDTNGRQDVYEWEREGTGSCPQEAASGGCIYLLSGGTSGSDSSLLDASANGNDVFLITRAQLLPEDHNESFDVYDARVGGVPRAAASECAVACQNATPAPPVFASPASAAVNGAGNLTAIGGLPGKPAPKSLTRAQKLAAALRACRKPERSRRRGRAACEAHARKLYGPRSKTRKPAKRGRGR
jgi:hypothetical protein